jgi:aminoglycoside phosphotransferase (APT) family kinase protein
VTSISLDDLTARVTATVSRDEPGAVVAQLSRLHGGASGLTYRGVMLSPEGSETPIVVKVAPPGLMPVKNRDVLRQARIMKALGALGSVPVPEILYEDAGEPPEVPPLFVMRFVDGQSWEPITDPIDEVPPPAEIRARELDVARTLGLLHSIPPEELGLGEDPIVGLDEELARWTRVIGTIPEDLRAGSDVVATRLTESRPAPVKPVVQHGDFRLGNTLARDGRVRAVIDWEIWTVGDPRVDLGWYLMSTHSSKQSSAVRDVEGMPPDEELIAIYEATSGTTVTDLRWFEAFTQFKAAAITGQIIKHNRRATEPNQMVATWDPHVPPTFLSTAARLLDDLAP